MRSVKILSLLFGLTLVAAASANPTYTGYNDNRFGFRRFVQPQNSVDFKLLVNPSHSILKIDNKVYHYGRLDFLELVSAENSCASATGLRLNGKPVEDITMKNGNAFRRSYSDLPRTFLLKGTLTSDMALPTNYSSGAAFFHGGPKVPKCPAGVPVVPVPGAILLGSCGVLILNKFRRIV